jgi:hypothetical protein
MKSLENILPEKSVGQALPYRTLNENENSMRPKGCDKFISVIFLPATNQSEALDKSNQLHAGGY